MKAKQITKLRAKTRYYMVLRSYGMFGDFSGRHYTTVLARSPKEAAKRFMKRTNAIKDLNNHDQTPDQTNKMFGTLKVMPTDSPFERHVTYWK